MPPSIPNILTVPPGDRASNTWVLGEYLSPKCSTKVLTKTLLVLTHEWEEEEKNKKSRYRLAKLFQSLNSSNTTHQSNTQVKGPLIAISRSISWCGLVNIWAVSTDVNDNLMLPLLWGTSVCVHWELCQGYPPSTSTAASRIMGAYSETGSNECVICVCTLDLRSVILTRERSSFSAKHTASGGIHQGRGGGRPA